jgi:Resolvase, N terminal domain
MKRRIITPNATLVQDFVYSQQALPTHKPIVQYIRQSTTKQLRRNKQSYELQDTDLRRNLLAMGWLDNDESIIKIDSDQGKSGTKRRDERGGLDYLYELLENDRAGAVAAFDVSRLYRVLSRAEYGAFCDLVLERKIPVVTASRIYWPTRTDNDQLSDDFKAAAAFIEDIIKGKLIAAKNRHIQYDASYGGHSIPFGYVVTGMSIDETERKFYVVYEPHATLIRWLYRRFKELDGSIPALGRELERLDFHFPPFTPDVTARVSIKADESGGYPLRNRQAIIGALTNRAYIGYYEYGGVLVSKEAHEPIVSMDDFMFAYERLSGVSLDGTETQERKQRERRYSGNGALLDGVVGSGEHAVYIIEGKYHARSEHNGFPKSELVVKVEKVDGAFARAMVHTLAGIQAEQDIHTAIYEQVTALQAEQAKHATDYAKAIARIDGEIAKSEMAQRVSKELGDEQGYRDNTKQLVQLRKDRQEIEQIRDRASQEVEDLEDCHNLIELALRDWKGLGIDRQKRLIRMLKVRANLVELSPHFVRLDVQIRMPVARYLTMYLHRSNGSRQFWNEQEDETLRAMFVSASKEEVMQALPSHSWVSICYRGYEKLGIRRTATKRDTLTYGDTLVMQDYGARVDVPVWTTRYQVGNEYADVPGLFWWASQDEDIVVAGLHNEVQILVDRIGGALVPIRLPVPSIWLEHVNAALLPV